MNRKDDERLRKTAISFLKDFAEQGYENASECIDWLERQEEAPSAETILNVWDLGNIWKELTLGASNTEHGTQLDYIMKHWKEGGHYIKPIAEEKHSNADMSVQTALKKIWYDGYDRACTDMSEKAGWHDSEERPEEGRTILIASIDPEDMDVYYRTVTVDYKMFPSLMPGEGEKWMYVFNPMVGI